MTKVELVFFCKDEIEANELSKKISDNIPEINKGLIRVNHSSRMKEGERKLHAKTARSGNSIRRKRK